MPLRFPLCLVMLIGPAMLAGGCAVTSDQMGARVLSGTDPWPFMPASMRIHPFTSIGYDEANQTPVLDAFIVLQDRMGDATKGVGEFLLELYQKDNRASANPQDRKRLYVWNVPLLTLDQNRRHYDVITRTYLFKLKMDRMPAAGTDLHLVVQFTDGSGQRLMAETDLTISERTEPRNNLPRAGIIEPRG